MINAEMNQKRFRRTIVRFVSAKAARTSNAEAFVATAALATHR